jgi:1-acyl-sn-glycerol-3-phosphate acyltransferase
MKHPLRKIRLILHVARGLLLAATVYPRVSAERQQEMIRSWSRRMLALCGMELVVHQHGETLAQGAMVVGNHVSWIDIYVIDAWRPTPFVSKAEIANWPVIGRLAKTIGTVFIQREKRSDAKKIMHQLADILSGGGLIAVFPEGTTTEGRSVLPFHANMFQAPVLANAPVQPICLMYEDRHGKPSSAPSYAGETTLMEALDAMLDAAPLKAHLYVGQPLTGSDRRQLAEAAQQVVGDALAYLQSGCTLTVASPRPAAGRGRHPGAEAADGAGESADDSASTG